MRVGTNGASGSGNLTVSTPITRTGTLVLAGKGTVTQTGTGTLTVTNLGAVGDGGVTLNLNNVVSSIAGSTVNQAFSFNNNAGGTLTVGTIDGVAGINAGTGAVTLNFGTSSVAGVIVDGVGAINNGVPAVTGGVVTLNANGPTNGNGATGQIGTSTSYFEVKATTINATTKNSRLWIANIGTSGSNTMIGTINAGTEQAFLKTISGNLNSSHTGTTPDVIASSVTLIGSSASFGTVTNPLLLQTANLASTVTGSGAVNATHIPASAGMTVSAATTASGNVNINENGVVGVNSGANVTINGLGTAQSVATERTSERNELLPGPGEEQRRHVRR